MSSLEELGLKHGTGKSAMCCNYLKFYELLFKSIKFDSIKILEIGVQFGLSLITWRDYFPNAWITGIDAIDTGVAKEDRITVSIGNAYSEETMRRLNGKFNIIIDDGSHIPSDQVFFVKNYTDLLTPNGVLIVEDVLSRDIIGLLKAALPSDFDYAAMDSIEGNVAAGCRLFICWRKPAQSESVSATDRPKT